MSCPVPIASYVHILLSHKTLNSPQLGQPEIFMESLPVNWGPGHMKLCMHSLGVESLFLTVLWSSLSEALLFFHAKCSGGYSCQCQPPGLGNLIWGSELSLLRESVCNILIFHFVCCSSGMYRIS